MRVNPVSFKFNAQNSPSQKGLFKFKPEFPGRVFYTPCKDETFQEGGTDDQREAIRTYYLDKHPLSLNRHPKFLWYIEYPMQETTMDLEEAYFRYELDKKHPPETAKRVRQEVEALRNAGWVRCTKVDVDRQIVEDHPDILDYGQLLRDVEGYY